MFNYFWISIKGNDRKRILNNIFNEKINVLAIKYLKDEIIIKISYSDYKKLRDVRSPYNINVIKMRGKIKIHKDIIKYRLSIISFLLGALLIVFFSFHIFYINIDTNNNELKKDIETELRNNNITLFSRKRTRNELEKVKDRIKKNNLNSIEWMEINNKGVVLEVKVIERVKRYGNYERDGSTDIIATKSGYIRKILATSGDVLKNTDDYVNKGEVIISGNIIKNDEVVAKTKSKGFVFAEVWYKKKISKDLEYITLVPTDKTKFRVIFTLKDKSFNLINIPMRSIKNKNITLFNNNIFSLKIKQERLYRKKHVKYTDDELVNILEKKAKDNVLKTLSKDEYIISEKTLKKYKENDKITIEILFKVYEEIGMTVKSPDNYIKKEE